MDMSPESGERLARIEAKVDSIIVRLDKMNGTLGRHDDTIGTIKIKCGVHDAETISEARDHRTLDNWRAVVDDGLKALETTKATVRSNTEWRGKVEEEMRATRTWIDNYSGKTSGYGQLATAILSLVTLALVLYQTSVAHQAAHPAPAVQHQAK